MKEEITKYYDNIIKIAENNFAELGINIEELKKVFSNIKTQKFDLLNFFLIEKAIISEAEKNFQVLIPDKYFKDNLLSPILLASTIIKYKQNVDYYKDIVYQHSEILEGAVFYLSKKKRLCRCVNTRSLSFGFVNETKKEKNANTSITITSSQLSRLHKLRNIENFDYNGNSGKHFEKYLAFYENILNDYEALVTFKRKTVIIAEHSITNSLTDNKYLPFRYNMEQNDTVPVKPLIEIFNSYEQAREYLKENENTDEVIIIGYQKYQNSIGKIQNDQNKGLFNKLILIGSKKIDNNDFKIWQWTNSEINYLTEKEISGDFAIKEIKSEALISFQNKLNEYKNELIQIGVKDEEAQSIVNYFSNLFARQLILEKAKLLEYINSIFEDSENDLYFAINEAGKPKEKYNFKDKLVKIIEQFSENYNSGKFNFITNQKLTDNNYYLISENRQVENLNKYFTKNSLKIEPITNRNIEKIISHCDINDKNKDFTFNNVSNREIIFRFSKRQILKNVFIVPYIFFKYENPLWYYHIYNKITEFGNVYILNYKDIENDRIEMFKTLYQKQEIYRQKHNDRLWFVNIEYPEINDIDEETKDVINSFDTIESETTDEAKKTKRKKIKQFFTNNFKIKSDFNRKSRESDITGIDESNTEAETELVSREKYKISFSANDYIEVGEYEKFAKKETGNYKLAYAKDLAIKNEIIRDWNVSLRDILKILNSYSIFQQEVNEINETSKLWQTWLEGLLENFKRKRTENEPISYLHQKLRLSVSIETMKNWLENKTDNFFPRYNSDLQAIIDLKLFLTPENNETNIARKEKYRQQAENIKKGSTSLLYEVKRELTIYVCTKNKGKILSVLNSNHLAKLLNKKETATIQNIQKL